MKTVAKHTAVLLLCLLASACATMETNLSWLDNSQKIDEENSHK